VNTQIDKVTGEPFLDRHYNLYKDGVQVAGDVPFETLAASQEIVSAIMNFVESIESTGKFTPQEFKAWMRLTEALEPLYPADGAE